MKKLIKYETLDKKLYDNFTQAKTHAESLYCDKLVIVSCKLAKMQNHIIIGDYINNNIKLFVELNEYKASAEMVEENFE
jgi:hypothetical protein